MASVPTGATLALVTTQSSVWDEVRARRAAAGPAPAHDAAPAHEPAGTAATYESRLAAEPEVHASEPEVDAPEPEVHAPEPAFEVVEQAVPTAEPARDDKPAPDDGSLAPNIDLLVQSVERPASRAPRDTSLVPDPDGWTDALTGTEGPRFWERMISKEEARRRRYGRGATVALIELTGFEGDRVWYGRELATQFFSRIGRALAREVRTSDHIARIAPARFGIILLETDEIGAINFIDRVRAACRKEFWAGCGLGVRTGWASASEAVGLGAAAVLAEKRLDDPAYQELPDPR